MAKLCADFFFFSYLHVNIIIINKGQEIQCMLCSYLGRVLASNSSLN